MFYSEIFSIDHWYFIGRQQSVTQPLGFIEDQDLIRKTVGDPLPHVGATVLLSLQISLLTNMYKLSHKHIFSVFCYRYTLVVIMKKLLVALAFCFFLVFVTVLYITYHHDLKSALLESPPLHVIRHYLGIQQVGLFLQFYLAFCICRWNVPFGGKGFTAICLSLNDNCIIIHYYTDPDRSIALNFLTSASVRSHLITPVHYYYWTIQRQWNSVWKLLLLEVHNQLCPKDRKTGGGGERKLNFTFLWPQERI